jgi:hypothetical protein
MKKRMKRMTLKNSKQIDKELDEIQENYERELKREFSTFVGFDEIIGLESAEIFDVSERDLVSEEKKCPTCQGEKIIPLNNSTCYCYNCEKMFASDNNQQILTGNIERKYNQGNFKRRS